MPEEKRRFVRLSASVDVNYTKKEAVLEEKSLRTKDISAGGICIISFEPLQESGLLDLKISIPEEASPINAVGRVVWVKEFIIGDISKGKRYDVGVEFIKISGEDRNKINKYVFSHL